MSLPPVYIRVGPAGSGKTHQALARCGAGCSLVLPSEGAIGSLVERDPGRKEHLYTFIKLAIEILRTERRGDASPALRTFFLRDAVRESVQPGSYFSLAAGLPGFAPAIGDLIREFRQALVTPEDFLHAARACAEEVDDPLFPAKCESVATIWQAYERLLVQHETLDTEDLLNQAIAAAGEWRKRPRELIVDGFTTFTRQQIALLAALREAGVALEVCLTADRERPILFARTERTLRELQENLETVEVVWERGRAHHLQTESLRHLEQNFLAKAQQVACGPSVQVFEAPDPVMEAEMVARAIHRLISEGTAPERIAVVQRGLDGAGTLLKSTFSRYGVPISFNSGEPLADNPLVSLVSAILRLFVHDWPRVDLIRCAKASYFPLPPEEVDLLERRAMARAVHGGRFRWLRLLNAEEREKAEKLVAWMNALAYWQDRLTKPAPPGVLVKLIIQMAGFFGLTRSHGEDEATAQLDAEDASAWRYAKAVLTDIAKVEQLRAPGDVTFAPFVEAVMAAWQSGIYALDPRGKGHVQILEAFDARQQEFDAVFLMGMNERVFPRVVADNAFLRDDERQALAKNGVVLQRQVELADEERLLFYRALTAASQRLVLSLPRTSGDGREALTSYYLDEVRQLFTDEAVPTVSRTLADAVPDLEEAVGLRERVLCASAALGGSKQMAPEALQALQASLAEEKPALFADLPGFLNARPDSAVKAPALREHLVKAVEKRAFSVSELEGFLSCPYQHFLSYQLKLREVTDEVGAAELGSLLHAVLREFFCECREACRGSVRPFLPPDAMARMEEILDRWLPWHIRDPRPSRVQMSRHAALAYLERFLEREQEYQESTHMVPTYFELAFGPQKQRSEETVDSFSRDTPLTITGPDGEVTLAGKIDRVDLTEDGQAAIVIDYKLSHTSSLREMMDGTSLQMPVYLLAMEQVFGIPVVAAVYQPMRRGNPYWLFRAGMVPGLKPNGRGDGLPPPRHAELIAIAREAILAAAAGIRSVQTEPVLGDGCRFCSFADVCRADERKADA